MKTETLVVASSMVFLGVIGAVYWLTSYESTGTTLLLVGALAYLLMGGYLFVLGRRLQGPRPEDRKDATPADATGAVGYFPAASVWPAALGLGVVLIAISLVFGPWFSVLGGIVTLGAVIGYAVEAEARH
jgi:hypothetical protein